MKAGDTVVVEATTVRSRSHGNRWNTATTRLGWELWDRS